MVAIIRPKALVLIFLFCLGFLPIQNTVASMNTSTSTDHIASGTFTVSIVNLTVQINPDSMDYVFYIQIYNPNSISVTVNHYSSCGYMFGIVPVTSNTQGLMNQGMSGCNFGNNGYPKTYKPGYTYQFVASDCWFSFYSGKDFPIGFYFFDIEFSTDGTVPSFSAVYMYFGNNVGKIEYQTANSTAPFNPRPTVNSGVPLSQELASYQNPTTKTTNSAILPAVQNDFTVLIPLVFVFIPVVLAVGYVVRKKGYFSHTHSLSTTNNSTNTMLPSNPVHAGPNICYSCQAPILKDDVFCSNCGTKLL